jgi:hypothetical protein
MLAHPWALMFSLLASPCWSHGGQPIGLPALHSPMLAAGRHLQRPNTRIIPAIGGRTTPKLAPRLAANLWFHLGTAA